MVNFCKSQMIFGILIIVCIYDCVEEHLVFIVLAFTLLKQPFHVSLFLCF